MDWELGLSGEKLGRNKELIAKGKTQSRIKFESCGRIIFSSVLWTINHTLKNRRAEGKNTNKGCTSLGKVFL